MLPSFSCLSLVRAGYRRVTAICSAIVLLAFFGLLSPALEAQTFVHPGIRHSKADLDTMAARVFAGQEPWNSAYDTMLAWPGFRDGMLGRSPSSLSFTAAPCPLIDVGENNMPHTGQDEALTDATAAYIHALQWYVTGNSAHAEKTIEILNAWGTTLNSFNGIGKELSGAWICSIFCEASEIVRTTYPAGAPASRWTAFDGMLRTKFWPLLQNFKPTYNGNWDALITQAIMSMGVVLNDTTYYNTGRNYFVSGAGNGSLPNYVAADGTTQESTRDQAHEQMGVLALTSSAEIAWKQGEDLYATLSNRLLLGLEGTAQRTLAGSGSTLPGWDIAYNHYHNRRSLATPQMQTLLNSSRHLGASWSRNTVGLWPLLMFRDLGNPALPAIPTVPSALTATSVGSTQINLNWNHSTRATRYNLKRATTSGGPYTTIAAGLTSGDSYSSGSLASNTTYYYVVSAVNASGESANSAQVSAKTMGAGAPPAPPSRITLTPDDTQMILTWPASPEATGYNVKRGPLGGPYTTIASNVTATNYAATGLSNGITYYFVVSSVNGATEGPDSIQSSATMPTFVDNADTSGVTLTPAGGWTASTTTPGYYRTNYLQDGNTGATGGRSVRFTPTITTAANYQLFLRWSAASNRATLVPVDIVCATGTVPWSVNQQEDNGTWMPQGIYSFNTGSGGSVLVRNDGANGYVTADAAKFVRIMPALPAAPAGLTATAASSSTINLSWTASPGATSYTIGRGTANGGPYTTIATGVTGTTTTSGGLAGGTAYYYVVSGANSGNQGVASAPAAATTLPAPPAAPTGVTAMAGNARILLDWGAVTGATGYQVKRATVSGGPYTLVSSPTTSDYIDTGLTNGTTYYYVILATNTAGSSGNSAQVSAKAQAVTVIKDNADAAGVTKVGAWTNSTLDTGYYGSNYCHDGNSGSTGGKKVTFVPTIPVTGNYEVYGRWTAAANRGNNVPYDMNHSGGTTVVTANQRTLGSQWVLLGTYVFNAGTAGSVAIRDDAANGFVIADAVQFILK